MKSSFDNEADFVAYINEKSRNKSYTALHYAAYNLGIDELQILLDNSADINALTSDGFNVLHTASQGKNLPALIFLVEQYGLDVNCKDLQGCTPLHWCAFSNFKQGVEYLVQKNSQLDIPDNSGLTPLLTAMLNERSSVIEDFVFHQVSLTAKDNYDRSCDDYAKAMKHKEYFEFKKQVNFSTFKAVMCNIFLIFFYLLFFVIALIVLLPWINNKIFSYAFFGISGIFVMLTITEFLYRSNCKKKIKFTEWLPFAKSGLVTNENICLYCETEKKPLTTHCFICNSCTDSFVFHSRFFGRCFSTTGYCIELVRLILFLLNVSDFFVLGALSISFQTLKKDAFPFVLDIPCLMNRLAKNILGASTCAVSLIMIIYLVVAVVRGTKKLQNINQRKRVQDVRKERSFSGSSVGHYNSEVKSREESLIS